MDQGGVTWIVTADARQARVFSERVRGGELIELDQMRMQADDQDRPAAHSPRATVHDRNGPGRHGAGDRNPSREVERRFLKRVASRLVQAASGGQFDRLVLMAPPRALGVLRMALTPVVAAKIEVSDPHERRDDGPAELRLHLREARAGAPA